MYSIIANKNSWIPPVKLFRRRVSFECACVLFIWSCDLCGIGNKVVGKGGERLDSGVLLFSQTSFSLLLQSTLVHHGHPCDMHPPHTHFLRSTVRLLSIFPSSGFFLYTRPSVIILSTRPGSSTRPDNPQPSSCHPYISAANLQIHRARY